MIRLSTMDYIRDALANAKASGMGLDDVIRAAEHAASPQGFNDAVNIMGETTPRKDDK